LDKKPDKELGLGRSKVLPDELRERDDDSAPHDQLVKSGDGELTGFFGAEPERVGVR
jgi:hypothetical protein